MTPESSTTTVTLEGVRLIGGDPSPVDVRIADGRIADISLARAPVRGGGGGGWMAPGLVDLQVNGGWGHDLSENPGAVWEVGTGLAGTGVTSWLPTLVSCSRPVRAEALAVLAAGPPPGWVGALPLGWHFEGPYLNPARAGAHRLDALEAIPEPLARGDVGDEPLPALMTIAPELPDALAAIAALTEAGVVVSIGHSEASPTQVADAVTAGASMGTHLFNAMSGLDHRQPGTAVGLLSGGAWLGLIADGYHVDPDVVRLTWNLAGRRLVLVSDAMAGLGQPDGAARLAGRHVLIEAGAVRLPSGTLAGSVLPLLEAAGRFQGATGCDPVDLITVASSNPRRVLGHAAATVVEPSMVADLILFDADGALNGVYCAGRRVEVDLGTATSRSPNGTTWRLRL